jgi:hypothetical protein
MSLKANRDRGKVLGIHDVTKRRLREEKVELPLFLKSNFDIFHFCFSQIPWIDLITLVAVVDVEAIFWKSLQRGKKLIITFKKTGLEVNSFITS